MYCTITQKFPNIIGCESDQSEDYLKDVSEEITVPSSELKGQKQFNHKELTDLTKLYQCIIEEISVTYEDVSCIKLKRKFDNITLTTPCKGSKQSCFIYIPTLDNYGKIQAIMKHVHKSKTHVILKVQLFPSHCYDMETNLPYAENKLGKIIYLMEKNVSNPLTVATLENMIWFLTNGYEQKEFSWLSEHVKLV